MLNIKPILCMEDGLVKPLFQARGKKQVIAKIIELIKEQAWTRFKKQANYIGCGDKVRRFRSVKEEIK